MNRIIQDTTAAVAREAIKAELTRGPHADWNRALREALRDLNPTNPTEHQISMAGGDGEPTITPRRAGKNTAINNLRAAADGDGEPEKHHLDHTTENTGGTTWHCICGYRSYTAAVFKMHLNAPVPAVPRTEDYTMLELFPDKPGTRGVAVDCCTECGAFVPYERERQTHVTWHNKLLP